MNVLKKILLIGLIGSLCFAGSSLADDSWTGPYVGGSIGAIMGSYTSTEYYYPYDYGEYSFTTDLKYLLGIQGGFNKQIGSTGLVGVELDVNLPDFDETRDFEYSSETVANHCEWNYYSTLRLRGGLVVDNTLIYVTGGVAVVDVDYAWGYLGYGSDPYYYVEESGTEIGYAAGAGIEFKVNDNLSVGGKYLYIGLPTTKSKCTYDDDPVDFESHAHTMEIGVNYMF